MIGPELRHCWNTAKCAKHQLRRGPGAKAIFEHVA
jgi:hypothetical protein